MFAKQLISVHVALILSLAVSIIALAGALIGQFMFDLPPCNLCIYQRIPFVAVIVISAIALFQTSPAARKIAIGLNEAAFAVNAAIAVFHTGVEQKWWEQTEGCKVSFDFAAPAQSFFEQITSAQTSSCAAVPWIDPVFGLSMANLNVALCAAMALYMIAVLFKRSDD